MGINVSTLAQQMLAAAQGTVNKKQWSELKAYAEKEFKAIAESIAFIEMLSLQGRITHEEAALHFSIQKNATRTVLLTIKGIGLLQAEAAINAALTVVKTTVNTALGFALIV